jgi:hypothetical protein
MPPHLKVLSDLRKAKRRKNNTQRTASTAVVAAGGSPTPKGGKGPSSPHTKRVDKLAAIIASPPPRKTDGRRPQAQPGKATNRWRGKSKP